MATYTHEGYQPSEPREMRFFQTENLAKKTIKNYNQKLVDFYRWLILIVLIGTPFVFIYGIPELLKVLGR